MTPTSHPPHALSVCHRRARFRGRERRGCGPARKRNGCESYNPQRDRYEEFSAANADNALPMALMVRLQRRLQVDL